jgi:hypothetical protein
MTNSRKVVLAGAVLLVPAVVALGGIIYSIQSSVGQFSDAATARFPGGRTEALIAVVECETCSLQERNHAVWTLGRLQAEAALPALKKHYDGQQCTHESRLCQYELQKAIEMIEGRHSANGRFWNLVAKWQPSRKD